MQSERIAVIGAGLGGLTCASLLVAAGFDVTVYEQSRGFERIGAGIHLGPNVFHVMRAIGVADRLVGLGAQPRSWISREAVTGDVMLDYELGEVAEQRYGAPYLTVHRADFHTLLSEAVPQHLIRFGYRLVDIDVGEASSVLRFENGETAEVDLVVGADGVRSRIRELLLGPEHLGFSGQVAFRSVFPSHLLNGLRVDDCVKWWGEDRIFMSYFITRERDEMFFVTASPQAEWASPTSSVPGSKDELNEAFADFHPEVRALIERAPEVSKWAMFDQAPLPLWCRGRIVMLGDACHPMLPFMGQGAAMAIEDAAILQRCLSRFSDYREAFECYERTRRARAERVQSNSRKNNWLKSDADPDWVFGYNSLTAPLL